MRSLKWTTGALLTLLITSWLVSYLVPLTFCINVVSVGVTRGYAFAGLSSHPATTKNGIWWSFPGGPPQMGVAFGAMFDFWLPHRTSSSTGMGYPPNVTLYTLDMIFIPMFWLALAAACAFAVVWRRDRRRPLPGHCRKCNYNLTGNISGVCPECGTPTPAAL